MGCKKESRIGLAAGALCFLSTNGRKYLRSANERGPAPTFSYSRLQFSYKACKLVRGKYNARMSDTWKGLLKDLFTLALLIVVVVIPIRLFVVSPFIVDGDSMHPTFENLDYLIIDEIIYRFRAPERGDVVVFHYPGDPSIFYIKRVIGLPGE